MKKIIILLTSLSLNACLGMPDNVSPVEGFESSKYLGKWYEIARLDHTFERNLEQVSATYSLRPDGGITVDNRGFHTKKKIWKMALGKAYFVNDHNVGHLKVSFFGPFYGSYVIFDLDKENYEYAFVSGPKLSYLWLLSRKPTIDSELRERFINRADELGFDTDELIFVNQEEHKEKL